MIAVAFAGMGCTPDAYGEGWSERFKAVEEALGVTLETLVVWPHKMVAGVPAYGRYLPREGEDKGSTRQVEGAEEVPISLFVVSLVRIRFSQDIVEGVYSNASAAMRSAKAQGKSVRLF